MLIKYLVAQDKSLRPWTESIKKMLYESVNVFTKYNHAIREHIQECVSPAYTLVNAGWRVPYRVTTTILPLSIPQIQEYPES